MIIILIKIIGEEIIKTIESNQESEGLEDNEKLHRNIGRDVVGEIVDNIPVVSALKNIKTAIKRNTLLVKEEQLIKNIETFIVNSFKGINNRKNSAELKIKMIEKSKNNNEIYNSIILTLDNIKYKRKVEWVSKVFVSFLKEEIDSIMFLEYIDIIEEILIGDILFLINIDKTITRLEFKIKKPDEIKIHEYFLDINKNLDEYTRCQRLSGKGLFRSESPTTVGTSMDTIFWISKYGREFKRIVADDI